MRSEPAVSIVEAAYSLGGSHDEWLAGIAEAAQPLVGGGGSAVVAEYEPVPQSFSRVAYSVVPHNEELLAAFLEGDEAGRNNPVTAPRIHSATACQSTSESLQRWGLDVAALDALYAPRLHPLGIRDTFNIQGADVSGRSLAIMCGRPEHTSVPAVLRNVYQRVAVHLASALRLRRVLGDPGPSAALDSAQAIFDPDGRKLLHVAPEMKGRALDNLRVAAQAVDRARSRELRDDAPRALELWQGLFSGKWSLVDVFDSDGRRFFVAHLNDPAVANDRRLTRRERQAVMLAVGGHTDELAGYALGIAAATLRVHLKRGMRKLGVDSREQLVDLVYTLAPGEIELKPGR